MKVQELINAYKAELENGDYAYSIWDAEDILMSLDDTLKNVATDLNFDEHRWYIRSTNVYKCDDGFIGIRGVSSLKSEMMSYRDAEQPVEIFECIEKQTVTYVKK